MFIEYPNFFINKGDFPIELLEGVWRFIIRGLDDIFGLSWRGHWGFWQWFWIIIISVGIIIGIITMLRKKNT